VANKRDTPSVTAIVPGAGLGRRIGKGARKPFLEIAGRPVIQWTLELLESVEAVGEIIPVLRKEDMEDVVALVEACRFRKVRRIAPGGEERQASVYNGLRLVREPFPQLVLVHDAVRPLASRELVARVIEAALPGAAVVPGVPVQDTIKEVDDRGRVTATPRRDVLRAVQTPQVFPFAPLIKAHKEAVAGKRCGWSTDDAALIERFGGTVRVVEGERTNIKITTPLDLILAEAILKERRKGV